MLAFTIDGQTIEAKPGQTIIQAAFDNGITIPHFCWHPALSVAGNCRMCLVDVGMPKLNPDRTPVLDEHGNPVVMFMPKLQIACATQVSEGMVVRLHHDKVKAAQEAVMEFLLINHPLDCPICDEAGQCKLQEYSYKHSKGESRFIDAKNHKDKRVPLGPNVLFDAERCISCSRCIRYANEHAKQPVLTFVQRGDHVTIETFPGTQFDSPYSMNVIELCPVGALTSRDFRFKARVWDMSFNKSICPGCARGCNMSVGVRNNEILRLEPATNMDVNQYWMCDYGRLTQFPFVNQNRIKQPLLRHNDGTLADTDWDTAIAKAAELLSSVPAEYTMVIGSAKATNEDNYTLVRFAREVLRTPHCDFFRHENPLFGDTTLRHSDMTPNSTGAHAVGVQPSTGGIGAEQLAAKITSGDIRAVYVMEDDIATVSPELAAALDTLSVLIVHASNFTATVQKAHLVFAAPTYAELEGTYTNFQQRVQHLEPCLVTAENERRMGMKMSRLDKFGTHNDRWTQGERRHCRQSWRVLTALAKAMGADAERWNYRTSEDVFAELTRTVPFFAGMSYALLDEHKGVISGKADRAYSAVMEYESHSLKPS
ncbi:MAG: 2Fe-2S iron-sulfur cluster-binding protein [Bacteroidota bacterium]|nr:2Fe-2S iron-sulfur cluster-binding protein [Candidatus Kapabacteria bacterium]MDW8220840.1 2Fe-2S iron-sulfur cluster-binding protein [Bacteroidota bacterium]